MQSQNSAEDRSSVAWLRALELTARIPDHPSRTFPTVIGELAAQFGEKPALLSNDGALSFHALDTLANRYARWALALGITRGDTICLLMKNRPEYMAIWIGIARAGGVTALINTSLTGPSLAHSINVANPKHLIAALEFVPVLETARPDLVVRPRIWTHGGAAETDLAVAINHFSGTQLGNDERSAVTINDQALYVYTSGTTGRPKAAIVTHYRLMMWTHWFAGMMNTRPNDRLYNCLPMYHSVGGAVATGAVLVNGGAAVIRDKFSASVFWDDVVRFECTLFQYIGELCRYLLHAPPGERELEHQLRLICGNGLSADIWIEFKRRFRVPRILEFYASTEGNVSLFNVEGKPGSIGRLPSFIAHRSPVALARFDFERDAPLRNAHGFCLPCKTNEIGEALGRIVDASGKPGARFDGYTSEQATAEKVLRDVFERGDAWYRTGDLMRRDENGFYYFIDRIGDTFRWKGENVATTEVAAALTAYPGIVDANVYGVPLAGNDGRAGLAELVCTEEFEIGGLVSYLADRLPRYAHPVFLRLSNGIDVTSTFKRAKGASLFDGRRLATELGPLFVIDRENRNYLPLDEKLYGQIADGTFKV
jgi:fatty-acyl-CoA synthase